MTSIAHDDPVVVIIGSGAGGGTMAYELTRNGVPCVLIEAGRHFSVDDWENDEWAAFGLYFGWFHLVAGVLLGGLLSRVTPV